MPMLFPTTVIGSLPRPAWIRDIILDRKAGDLDETSADKLLNPAVEAAVRLQERAGLDEVTDGEWRRESYVKVFAERVHGFENDLIKIDETPTYPAVVGRLESDRPLVVDESRFIRPLTGRRIKTTIPAPYIIGRRMWHPEHSKKA